MDEIGMSNAQYMYGQSKLLLQTWLEGWRLGAGSNGPSYVAYWNPGPVFTDLGAHSVPYVIYPTYWLMKKFFFVYPPTVANTMLYLLSTPTPLPAGGFLNMRLQIKPHAWTEDANAQRWVHEKATALFEAIGVTS
uniref:Uncharacterized protein n=1 Tax=Lotharella oceanica TaxID=641309 RepID=A0A7S2XD69_9EUKA|mmetsp:Transcript_30653/g.57267  ORF Transcript_30653/g.57267 Transcript_30653/m.57267 type:complete len:135 (+) Transcript_30653:135-539(+)